MGVPARAWSTDQTVEAAQTGDERALAALVEESHPHVQRFAQTMCGSPQDAEDAAQEALMILYRQIGTLRATAALTSWMFRIVKNECLRMAIGRGLAPAEPEAADPAAERAFLDRLENKRIVEAISSLPPEHRDVFVLRELRGYSGATTAELLGISRTAMKSRLHRARSSVRAQLSGAD